MPAIIKQVYVPIISSIVAFSAGLYVCSVLPTDQAETRDWVCRTDTRTLTQQASTHLTVCRYEGSAH